MRQRCTTPAFMHGKGRHSFTSEPVELGAGFAKRHHGAHGYMGWQAQECLDLGFLSHRQCGESPAIPFMPCGQQNVPRKRIDRRAADDPDTIQILVRGGHHLEVDADHEHHCGTQHRLD